MPSLIAGKPKIILHASKIKLASATVAQSAAVDPANGDLYTLQVRPPAGERAGHLTVTRYDRRRKAVTGRMALKGFGHGVALGVEPGGLLWVEAGPIVRVDGSARGTRLACLHFANGKTRKSADVPTIAAPGRRCTPCVDVANDQLGIRYWDKKRGYRWAVYRLSDARAGRLTKLAGPFTMPSSRVHQGWCLAGGQLYQLSGANRQTALIHSLDIATGERRMFDTHTRRPGYSEPEGIFVAGGFLYFGIASGHVGARRYYLYRLEH